MFGWQANVSTPCFEGHHFGVPHERVASSSRPASRQRDRMMVNKRKLRAKWKRNAEFNEEQARRAVAADAQAKPNRGLGRRPLIAWARS